MMSSMPWCHDVNDAMMLSQVREEEKVEHERKLVRVEAEMSEVFDRKVS